MAVEMEHYLRERAQAMQTRAAEVPKELQELAARIERLRERLRRGDPDMVADELQAAIEKAEGKRAELLDQQPAVRQSAKVLAALPKAADLYRRQIELGLEGDERAALKARIFLRELLGRIDLRREGKGELWAEYGMQPAALLKVVGFSGSGGPLVVLFAAASAPQNAVAGARFGSYFQPRRTRIRLT
jgi:hypothetical protein